MIITKIHGGLGNQMFQYATGFAVANRLKVPLSLDISYYVESNFRAFQLNQYNIHAHIATEEEIRRLHSKPQKILDIFRKQERIIREQTPWFELRRAGIDKKDFSFDERVLHARDNTYLDGYWASERYFTDVADKLLVEFSLRKTFSQPAADMARVIGNSETPISVHIRRGDYVSDSKSIAMHGALPMDYYARAMESMERQVPNARYFVFSDDINWVQKNFPSRPGTEFVPGPPRISDMESMRLLSLCKHHIIANSSFSWWGAWLCTNPGKIVIAPQQWALDPTRDTSNIVPEGWQTM